MKVRKVRGPILDKLYARAEALRRPVLHRQAVHRAPQRPGAGDQPARLAARPGSRSRTTLTEAIRSGILAPGDELPSITELSALQGIGTGVIRHALEALAADGLIIVRHGRAAVVAGEPEQ